MRSAEIRQSFLDFFREKQHAIVPSSSLLPDSPNLLFTNAGMNQFVPIFLGQQKPGWNPPRVADTQKCIRAGGKHNDLDDVGLDTYHHTFFEMLGNWSFGDYFKREAIEWAWELVIERWKLPPQRLYATVYKPGPNEPSAFDQEAHDHWARLFVKAGLDPAVHIVNGNKKDNFWMMGDTGPCGPCSELHIDLTPAGDTKGSLVNAGDPRCMEIWNLVFIQFNANPDGTFTPLPQRHVDTGMGFERVTAMIQGTKNFSDFSRPISNYETDVFRPIFDEIEKLSGKTYASTLPQDRETPGSAPGSGAAFGGAPNEKIAASRDDQHASGVRSPDQIALDVAFRVIADHIRTLSFAIADGIQPSNEGRGYVLRRILRRAVRYGRSLGFHEPFLFNLVNVLVQTIGDVFSELREKQELVRQTIRREEESFNKTLDRGLDLFEREVARLQNPGSARGSRAVSGGSPETSSGPQYSKRNLPHFERPWAKYAVTFSTADRKPLSPEARQIVLDSVLHWNERRYALYAATVMPDHVHLLFEPKIESNDATGQPVFYSLTKILHTIKSFTAHEINKLESATGPVWEKESFDRLVRSERDLEEKFEYITRNPWDANVVQRGEEYPWVWWPEQEASRRAAEMSTPAACAPQISGEFAFRLYDEQGFPLDLTELMARERGLAVDVAAFEKLMDEQRDRARKAQKKEIIEVAGGLTFGGELSAALIVDTDFVGYEQLECDGVIAFPYSQTGRHFLALRKSPFYAEMGGQVGDTGELAAAIPKLGTQRLSVRNTIKRDTTYYVEIDKTLATLPDFRDVPAHLVVDKQRRLAIQRHHTVTHLLHWALHEVVSKDAVQKGSYVGPEKLTFDFSSAALTHEQVREVEKLVNQRIAEAAAVSWTEVPYVEAKKRRDIQQFFGDKYGEVVRIVQIGGRPNELNGYSMELCGGTHVRNTGDIGWFKIISEGAIAAGVRRIEALAGDEVRKWAEREAAKQDEKIATLSRKKSIAGLLRFENDGMAAAVTSIEARATQLKQIEAEVHDWEKQQTKHAEAELRARAINVADELATQHASSSSIVAELPNADGTLLQAVVDRLKTKLPVPIFLAGAANGRIDLVASVPHTMTDKVRANEIVQQVASLLGGKGGGRADSARGSGKNAGKLAEALGKARELLGV